MNWDTENQKRMLCQEAERLEDELAKGKPGIRDRDIGRLYICLLFCCSNALLSPSALVNSINKLRDDLSEDSTLQRSAKSYKADLKICMEGCEQKLSELETMANKFIESKKL